MDAARDGSSKSPMVTAADVDSMVRGAGLQDEQLGKFAVYFPDHKEKVLRAFQRLVAYCDQPAPAAVKAAVDQLLQEAAATNSAGRVSTAEVLRQALPSLPWGNTESKTAPGGLNYYVPRAVLPLEKDPLSGTPWTQEVIQTMQAADAREHWAPVLLEEIPAIAISEAGVAGEMRYPLNLLTVALNKASEVQNMPKTQGWVAETSTKILNKAIAGYAAQHPDTWAHWKHQTSALASPGSAGGPGSSSGPDSAHRQDVLLITSGQNLAQQPQQQQQQRVQQLQQQQEQLPRTEPEVWNGVPVAVGEYKKPTAVATYLEGSKFDPHDLKNLKNPFAQHVTCQVYTYLLFLQLQYAFISCYYWTWVVHLGKDRRTLYMSDAIAHDTFSSKDSPKVTAMGAIYWVQRCGLLTFEDKEFDDIDWDNLKTVKDLGEVLPSSQEPPTEPDDSDADATHDPRKDGGNSKRGSRGSGCGGSKGSGNKGSGNKGSGGKGKGGKVSKKQHQSMGVPDGRLQLSRLICEGYSGLVMHGIFQGQPAVYKFYGPDAQGVAAGNNEARIYRSLEACQGDELPIFFGWGPLLAGVHCLATACVEGVPCSEIPSELHAAAARAAETALQRICAVQPGFLHGDLRLPNIMIQQASSDTAAPTAVIIDLAASRLDGTPAEVKAQFRQLKSLFRR